ncbi:hypothetical protein COW36_12110 [bacterium (Candidatus Blackallbacteria) CG17_big_fil_post_rev_8_21_14_2_50_48_46]|uniref:NlpC/P60 domain-containing protein n=1 Tax=bacterium (Candidatus Blackallbacteria) CG17_big_fil_post_rev_8_21_14_2_50_48_46 TaxID=2014261 RepID=A0A2M7G4P1_9BACT|nr:MAG: hypothetical protein COW64_03150 [bacterium (Candidatus Blackallbacteria) CG18_big_fil_WC_8_21_14_2_50_49_26]PIW16504.1 MAG: hypothetical protein COW36_12110 [bacterium (Candidatus Blackallbacteria) CG17_big_fil_post_rev_8_21_14_2_50_48_46]PIW46012.1 MAG: hypothetical protein COW20_17375 [bacterium (Candidatus Blackallbacteria) CG13_big_fil_rev_8_21_14_2_50_49_14]
MKKLVLSSLLAAFTLSACSSAGPLLTPNTAQSPVRFQAMANDDTDLLARMLRNIFKENFADDVDNGRPAELIPTPRGGLVFEGMNRAWIVRAMLYPISDRIIKKEFNKPSTPDNIPPIDEAGLRELMGRLQPGDIVLCGNNDSFVHAFVYLGNDEIIHALAQLNAKGEFLGVIRETLSGYLKRIRRDKFVVLRKPGLSPQDVQKMRGYLSAQVGKTYDSLFLNKADDRFYCTELTWMALQQVAAPPRVYAHRAKYGWDLIKNEDFMDSPDLQTVWTYHYTRPPVAQRHTYH